MVVLIDIPLQQNKHMNLMCSYYDFTFENIKDTVCHCVEDHPAEKVSYMWKSIDGRSNRQRTYNVLGSNVTGKEISFDPQSGKMIVPTESTASDSPVRKLHKINTPSKSIQRQLYSQLEVDQEHVEDLSSTEATNSVADLSELLDTTVLYSDSEPDIEEYERMENANDIPDAVMADTQTVQMVVHQLKTLLPSVTTHLVDCGRLHDG
ncbi:hypothetical protein MAR_010009 [Mya arenaria]|uniref:Uncharacterized protein n=1 Tax=Mya arenaria TaxID=6604 RepID=A0ABY7E4J6_MYAAR|nr:hypothetical protein MAR_010009 [Mya arenaria]